MHRRNLFTQKIRAKTFPLIIPQQWH